MTKDFECLGSKVDVQGAVVEELAKLEPYTYYDEVINDYFGASEPNETSITDQ